MADQPAVQTYQLYKNPKDANYWVVHRGVAYPFYILPLDKDLNWTCKMPIDRFMDLTAEFTEELEAGLLTEVTKDDN